MDLVHPIFGELKLDEYTGYEGTKLINFSGREREVRITFDEEISEKHCQAYKSFIEKLDEITPDIIQSIIKYQNEIHDDSDYTASFKYFKTAEDVLENTELLEITLQVDLYEIVKESELYHKVMQEELNDTEDGRFVVLVFGAEWVNDDYHLLSVALANEKVVYVTDENITD
ncbi:MAG: hypothetical protein PUD42_05265 [Clostridiales bacterium]|nr:hypothetical protein [Clostridiales bacterium]